MQRLGCKRVVIPSTYIRRTMIPDIVLRKPRMVSEVMEIELFYANDISGSLKVHHVIPPLPRSLKGKFHILFAHLRQLHLTAHLLRPNAPTYDVYFVDQLSTCVPFLRQLGKTRVVFYCHFPDKLLANGAFVEGKMVMNNSSLLKRIYRVPMDWLEEITTRMSCCKQPRLTHECSSHNGCRAG